MAIVVPSNDAFRDLLDCVKQRLGKRITRAVALVPNPEGGVWVRLIENYDRIRLRRQVTVKQKDMKDIPLVISYILGERRNGEPVIALEVLGQNRYRWILRDANGATIPPGDQGVSVDFRGIVS
jgi:hypothetical protein